MDQEDNVEVTYCPQPELPPDPYDGISAPPHVWETVLIGHEKE